MFRSLSLLLAPALLFVFGTFVCSGEVIAATKKRNPRQAVTHELPAFPGAVGFGSKSFGGSGRHLQPPKTTVYRVTSLAESGPGTLRDCVHGVGPRVCVFEVGGRISLTSLLEIKNPYITIAGQTAPDPGITLTGAALKISTHDVVVRHIAVRVGDAPLGPPPPARDAVTINGPVDPVYNIVLDHLSLSWALDENVGFYGREVRDVTLMNSIISEGLHRSIHPDGPHSKGILVGDDATRISIHGCLLAHNEDRNPRQKPGSSLEFVNNVVYNWGGRSGHQANPADTEATNKVTLLSFAGNYYKMGPQSQARAALSGRPISTGFRAFAIHNYGPTRLSETDDEWAISDIEERPHRVLESPLPASGVSVKPYSKNYTEVLKSAGSRYWARDDVDKRIVSEVEAGTGSIKDCIAGCPSAVGSWPNLVETKRKLELPKHPNRDSDGDGYTDLEEWLEQFTRHDLWQSL